MSYNGILNIYKPVGITSFKCVSQIKKILGEKKVGHAGTLDPEAEGILPVCVGKATRCVDFFMDFNKTYIAEITFGITTNTRDIWGEIISEKDASKVTSDILENTMHNFCGIIQQVPPMFSALKLNGKPLYKYARQGIDLDLPAREVAIYKLELRDWMKSDDCVKAQIYIECSKGTYIRSLCHDIGEQIGCGAVMSKLIRSTYGIFKSEESVTPLVLEEAYNAGRLNDYILPIDYILQGYPKINLDDNEMLDYMNGKILELPTERIDFCNEQSDSIRIYNKGELSAIAKAEKQGRIIRLIHWKVFNINSGLQT